MKTLTDALVCLLVPRVADPCGGNQDLDNGVSEWPGCNDAAQQSFTYPISTPARGTAGRPRACGCQGSTNNLPDCFPNSPVFVRVIFGQKFAKSLGWPQGF